eukprot:763356-Hanusia_phi.AAC.4
MKDDLPLRPHAGTISPLASSNPTAAPCPCSLLSRHVRFQILTPQLTVEFTLHLGHRRAPSVRYSELGPDTEMTTRCFPSSLGC